MKKEKFRWIEGYEGLYQITSFGRVISVDKYDRFGRKTEGREIKLSKRGAKRDYWSVVLHKNGVSKNYAVHRLVAQAFIPNNENKRCVDHIDNDKNNNRVDNLRWVTHKENMNNPITVRRMVEITNECGRHFGTDNPFSRRIAVYKVTGEHVGDFDSAGLAIKELGLPLTTNVGRVCRGERKHTHGYVFRYLSDAKFVINKAYCKKKGCKPVIQTDLDDNFVAEYESIADAGRANNFNSCGISRAILGYLKTYKGYKWRYK